jgi:hypothetical protein
MPGRFDGIVLASALLIAAVCSGAGTAGGRESISPNKSADQQIFEGMVTDTRCGAKHSSAIGLNAGDCTIQCVRLGEHFSLVEGETSYILDGDVQALKRVAGQRVKISGTLQGNEIAYTSVTPD